MKDIIITLPAKIKWEEYQRELDAVSDGRDVLNFRVPFLPKQSQAGAKCYLAHKGVVVGWMKIHDLVTRPGFTCETTGEKWPTGHYIQRTGEFHYLPNKDTKQPGFQGWRYFN